MSALPITASNDLGVLGRNNDSPLANDNRDNGSSISDPQTLGSHSHNGGQTTVTDDTTWSRGLESSTPIKSPTSPSNQMNHMNLREESSHNEAQGPEPRAGENVDSTAMELDTAALEL
jgi:hypothetical protein